MSEARFPAVGSRPRSVGFHEKYKELASIVFFLVHPQSARAVVVTVNIVLAVDVLHPEYAIAIVLKFKQLAMVIFTRVHMQGTGPFVIAMNKRASRLIDDSIASFP